MCIVFALVFHIDILYHLFHLLFEVITSVLMILLKDADAKLNMLFQAPAAISQALFVTDLDTIHSRNVWLAQISILIFMNQ